MCISNYNPDVIARNVKQLGDGVIEIRRYNDGHIRADLSWVWFLCSIGFILYDYFTTQTLFRDVQWAISVDWALEEGWLRYFDIASSLGKNIPSNEYDLYKAEMLEMHWSRIYWGWFYILLPLFWFFMVASPKWRPVRFDAKRRLVYFWSWGQLYIMHYPKSVQRDREQLLSFLSPEFSPRGSARNISAVWCLTFRMKTLIKNPPAAYHSAFIARRANIKIMHYSPLFWIILVAKIPMKNTVSSLKKKNVSPVTTSTGSINLVSSHKSAITRKRLKLGFKHGWIKTIKNTKKISPHFRELMLKCGCF